MKERTELLDIVHPDYMKFKLDEAALQQKEVGYWKRLATLLEKMNKEKNKVARQMSRESFWQMVDDLEVLLHLSEDVTFKENLKCHQLDNFEFASGKKNYIVYGAGTDGKRIFQLLRLLNKEISFWCDNKLSGTVVDGMQVVTPEEAIQNYKNEVFIAASRKYQYEIMDSIVSMGYDRKNAIFEYDRIQAYRKCEEEYGKEGELSYPPLWITIGITSACPNKCLFCAYHGEDARDVSNVYGIPYMLSFDDFKRIVDMAKSGGVPQIHICATGEPFLNPEILKMVDYVIDKYGEVSLQTDFWKELYDKKGYLDEIIKREDHISYIATDLLSSVAEEHERMKKGASYKEFMEMMDYIGEHSNLVIRINYILTKQSYKHITDIVNELLKRNVNCEIMVVNLLSYDYSEFTSSDNVYTSKDVEITEELEKAKKYCEEKNIKICIPGPADSIDEECYVFWKEFQTWPVKGCDKDHLGDNMIPHACAAVVRGGLNSIGYLFEYDNIMDAWNNANLVEIRKRLISGEYPDEWCKRCSFYSGEKSYYKQLA